MFFMKKHAREEKTLNGALCHTDFHSHILPCIDDGSSSVEESVEMLRQSSHQGVKRIVATPHFYPHIHNVEDFVLKRDRAMEKLRGAVEAKKREGEAFPEVFLGAEVAFFSGISRSDSTGRLCINGTKMILVEMPFERWSTKVLNDLFDIKGSLDVVPIVAHIDRYLRIQPREIIDQLFEQEILVQANADGFIDPHTKKQLLNMLSLDQIDFLGSDCHGSSLRSPNLGAASEIIAKKMGEQSIKRLNEFVDFAFDGIESAF